VVRAFAIFSLPFILLETATGIISLASGYLSMPPLFGPGSGVDVTILMAGLAAVALRMRAEVRTPE